MEKRLDRCYGETDFLGKGLVEAYKLEVKKPSQQIETAFLLRGAYHRRFPYNFINLIGAKAP